MAQTDFDLIQRVINADATLAKEAQSNICAYIEGLRKEADEDIVKYLNDIAEKQCTNTTNRFAQRRESASLATCLDFLPGFALPPLGRFKPSETTPASQVEQWAANGQKYRRRVVDAMSGESGPVDVNTRAMSYFLTVERAKEVAECEAAQLAREATSRGD